MKTGNIESVEEKQAKNNSKYLVVTIDNQKFGVWKTELFNFCQEGTMVDYEFETKGEFKNILAIVPSQYGKPTTQNVTDTPKFVKSNGMNKCNALNNSLAIIATMQPKPIDVDTQPDKVLERVQMAKSIAKEFLNWLEE